MPCSVEDATRCSLLCTQMLTKCKPDKEKSKTDPGYKIRGAFLDFLFETYKASVNNRYPSRTGEINLINNFIAKMIHQYMFGAENKLVYGDGKQVYYSLFPSVKGNFAMNFVVCQCLMLHVQISTTLSKRSRWPAILMRSRPSSTNTSQSKINARRSGKQTGI